MTAGFQSFQQLAEEKHNERQLKGRNTDVADSVWLARVCQFGLATPSHVPSRAFREMRVLTRYRRTLISQRSRVRNRVQKVLDRSGVRVGGVLSDVFGRNGRRILDGLARGLDPDAILASLSHHVAHKLERLGDALSRGVRGAVERRILCDLLREHDALLERIEELDRDIDPGLEPWRERIALLQTIPGIDRPSGGAILAEVGPDLDAFASAERLAAWAGVCPGNDRSAGKRRSGCARMGNKAVRAVLVECAHAAARTHGCQFRGYYKALMVRRGYKRSIVATAHKLLRVPYVVLRDARPYHDPEADYEELMVRRTALDPNASSLWFDRARARRGRCRLTPSPARSAVDTGPDTGTARSTTPSPAAASARCQRCDFPSLGSRSSQSPEAFTAIPCCRQWANHRNSSVFAAGGEVSRHGVADNLLPTCAAV